MQWTGARRLTSTLLFSFFNDTATTEIYTLSLHDALPICPSSFRSSAAARRCLQAAKAVAAQFQSGIRAPPFPNRKDRKSTRLNSSHSQISYAVFCLKKKIIE